MKVFRQVRNALIQEGNFKKYLAYAIGEILLVMIGILLAFQVSSWNTQRIKDKAATVSYANIMRQINDDKSVILGVIDYNNNYLRQFEFANSIIENNDRSRIDTLGYIALNLTSYSDYNRNNNIYQNIVNSGGLSLLTNHEIIERLQQLEEFYIYMNRMERIHWDAILTGIIPDLRAIMKYSDRSVQNPETLYSYAFQNHFMTMMVIMNEKDQIYQDAVREIDEITALIEAEIKD